MTKSTITRELVHWLHDAATEFASTKLKMTMKPDEVLALTGALLASMDTEPVGLTDEAELRDVEKDGCGYLFKANPISPHADPRRVIKLYRHAQPAQVVPEEATPDSIEILASGRCRDHVVYQWDEDQRNAAADSWNACRAAMLEADPQLPGSDSAPVPGSWIPVSERMPPPRYEVLVGRWWGEKPRWCCKWATYIPGHPDSQSSGWLIPGASWTPTHWMPLPVAPQEVL
ncbi:DUF551 domain-containing protein [Klebsiella pneumoniae]|uniref:DUF551 domain-containing protein n=1 Tax=Klebsiella pneumoniae TaxID=573 RepID=UPI001CA3C28F|nr:DUF551 domain-containing protein [Klebsiella pneumoniae]EKZ5467874.1 DUF551 domain-containing protein [Klebsiella quasipneumoniae]EKU2006987.1 DUF551 domain-containing protein [Klebsiella pneumoniae]EKZ5478873.1 DUF551 domain-containing protein [Klebsiella quasipneumoniae]EKZ5643631.1 DUF551 domain-containing protein [Klebsiella quasipneumoniae]ELB4698748.1 DUF551 domain-containing protein [Klebsiella pneumoniae]